MTTIPLKKRKVTVEAHTASDTLTATETGSVHTNYGATGDIVLTLPSAEAGLEFEFKVMAAYKITVTAASGDTIRLGTSSATSTGGSVWADAVGESVRLTALDATQWVTTGGTAAVGTWT